MWPVQRNNCPVLSVSLLVAAAAVIGTVAAAGRDLRKFLLLRDQRKRPSCLYFFVVSQLTGLASQTLK